MFILKYITVIITIIISLQSQASVLNVGLKWEWSEPSYFPEYNQVLATPIIGQLNDDNSDGLINNLDVSDIVLVSFSSDNPNTVGILRALSGIDGEELWPLNNTPIYADYHYSPALADLDDDGQIEIISFNSLNGLISVSDTTGSIIKQFEKDNTSLSHVTIADLDSDSSPEFIVGNTVYNYESGKQFTLSGWESDIVTFDYDLDGDMEILVDGSLYDNTGELIWKYDDIGKLRFSSIANLDSDDEPEIIISFQGGEQSGVIVLEHNGELKWKYISEFINGGGAQAVSNFLPNGELGIAYTGYHSAVMLNGKGEVQWLSNTRDSSSQTGVTAFDFDSDGIDELIIQDNYSVRILDSITGVELNYIENSSSTHMEYPVIVDLEGDNNAELVVSANNYKPQYDINNGLRVFQSGSDSSWKSASRIWNQESFHLTNILQNGQLPFTEENSWLVNNTYRSSTLRSNWNLVWSDEFEYTGLPSSSNWGYETGFVRNKELQKYVENDLSVTRVSDGYLIIESHMTDKNSDEIWSWQDPDNSFISGSLETKGIIDWTYGRVEVRAKLPQGTGVWPAIWMLGTNMPDVGWPMSGEIDIMEYVGFAEDTLHSAVHTADNNWSTDSDYSNSSKIIMDRLGTDFHIFAIEWKLNRIDFFVDGIHHYTFQKRSEDSEVWPFNKPMYLKLNLAIGGSWGGQEGVDKTIFPQSFIIDYVRVYQ